MKAFLLAAGEGTRLRPVTDNTPKCLVRINGRPMLEIWLEHCRKAGVDEALINTHYFADEVRDYVSKRDFGLKVAIFFEEQLLGSAGTVLSNRDFVKGEQDFLIIYADNLTDIDMGKLVGFHRERGSEFTMGLFHSKRPEECGIAELDENGRVVRFTEKPGYPEGDLANTGIYVSGQGIFDHIPDEPSSDFGFDVLPKLAGKMYGYVIESYYLDMGTVAGYEQACRDSSAGRI